MTVDLGLPVAAISRRDDDVEDSEGSVTLSPQPGFQPSRGRGPGHGVGRLVSYRFGSRCGTRPGAEVAR